MVHYKLASSENMLKIVDLNHFIDVVCLVILKTELTGASRLQASRWRATLHTVHDQNENIFEHTTSNKFQITYFRIFIRVPYFVTQYINIYMSFEHHVAATFVITNFRVKVNEFY